MLQVMLYGVNTLLYILRGGNLSEDMHISRSFFQTIDMTQGLQLLEIVHLVLEG